MELQRSVSIYPTLNDNISPPVNEIRSLLNNLVQGRQALSTLTVNNFEERKVTVAQLVQDSSALISQWLNRYNGQFNGQQLALYVKTSELAIQLQALKQLNGSRDLLNQVLDEITKYASSAEVLSSNTQLRFNLTNNAKNSEILEQYMHPAKVTFDDIIGFEEEKKRIKNITSPLLEYLRPNRKGKTIILYGPSGTGKSFFVQAMANYLKAGFVVLTAAQLFDAQVGSSEKKIQAIFNAFHTYDKPLVIFFDEVEQVFPSRNSSNVLEVSVSLGVVVLQLMDGASSNIPSNVIIAAATNHLSKLDPALRSRFAPQIYIGLPNNQNKSIFLRKYFDDDIIIYLIDSKTLDMYSNRDLYNLCEGVLQYQLSEVADNNVFQWNENMRRRLDGSTGPGYTVVRNPVANIETVPAPSPLVPITDNYVYLDDAAKINNRAMIQRPDPTQYFGVVQASINPISEAELQESMRVHNTKK